MDKCFYIFTALYDGRKKSVKKISSDITGTVGYISKVPWVRDFKGAKKVCLNKKGKYYITKHINT